MASGRQIKTQIRSVKSTAKVTKALQMVVATKIKKTQARADQFKYYAEGILNILSSLGDLSKLEEVILAKNKKKIKNICILMFASNRGFTGSLNSNLTVALKKEKDKLLNEFPGVKLHGVSVYKYGLKIFNRLNIDVKAHFGDLNENSSTFDLIPVFKLIEESFLSDEFDMVYLFYPHFINTLVQNPHLEQLLPLKGLQTKEIKNTSIDLFEPDKDQILMLLSKEYFQSRIFNALLQTVASEFSSRFVAMKNATDNANQLIKDLSLKYNRIRQEKITKEMLDVVGGNV